MKTSVLGLVAVCLVATLATQANAIPCVEIYTDCLGATKTAQGTCPDCSTPPKSTEGCGYVKVLCPPGITGYKTVKVVCGNGCLNP